MLTVWELSGLYCPDCGNETEELVYYGRFWDIILAEYCEYCGWGLEVLV